MDDFEIIGGYKIDSDEVKKIYDMFKSYFYPKLYAYWRIKHRKSGYDLNKRITFRFSYHSNKYIKDSKITTLDDVAKLYILYDCDCEMQGVNFLAFKKKKLNNANIYEKLIDVVCEIINNVFDLCPSEGFNRIFGMRPNTFYNKLLKSNIFEI